MCVCLFLNCLVSTCGNRVLQSNSQLRQKKNPFLESERHLTTTCILSTSGHSWNVRGALYIYNTLAANPLDVKLPTCRCRVLDTFWNCWVSMSWQEFFVLAWGAEFTRCVVKCARHMQTRMDYLLISWCPSYSTGPLSLLIRSSAFIIRIIGLYTHGIVFKFSPGPEINLIVNPHFISI